MLVLSYMNRFVSSVFSLSVYVVIFGLIFSSASIFADDIIDINKNTPYVLTYDLGSPPADSYIWNQEPVFGVRLKEASAFWTCQTSAETGGSCGDGGASAGNVSGQTQIQLLFREQKSGATIILNITGERYLRSDQTTIGPYMISSRGMYGASEVWVDALGSFFIANSELSKIPTGGIWKAKLILDVFSKGVSPALVGQWTSDITLNVTDQNNQQIYIPSFGTAAPHVDLNLRPLPGTPLQGGKMSGQSSLDICLYDGYNANSSTFVMSADDSMGANLPGRQPGMFSVYQNGQTDDSHRIDYNIKMQNPVTGDDFQFVDGIAYGINNIAQASIRAVTLPGMIQSVMCVPSRLTFVTPEFDTASKSAGSYQGTVNLTFIPTM